jgi:acetolactate synthase-1/2/3 large subunit
MPSSRPQERTVAVHDGISRLAPDALLTGAEAVSLVLAEHGVATVFAYAGTSELALCDAIECSDRLRLVNARGDKECVFMAAGASLSRANRGVALVHGARGLTNAAGALADVRRNETGTLVIVGQASTRSARFLPPHAEPGLIATMGAFAQWSWEAPAVPGDASGRARAAEEFVRRLRDALASSAGRPARPSILGIPQDVAEARWIPARALTRPWRAAEPRVAAAADIARTAELMSRASRPLFLLDDFALRHPDLRGALADLTGLLGAPVLQLRYRRGPMLFERLREEEVGGFVGWFNPFSEAHNALLASCDLFVTVEDRNIYRRVVGALPSCRKVAVTGDRGKVLKNEYLGDGDVVLEGEVTATLRSLAREISRRGGGRTGRWYSHPGEAAARVTPEPACEAVEELRTAIAGAIGQTLSGWDAPALVDDSQMFGGLLAERYELLPPGLRVYGDHGGFVGGGLATATGLAIGDPSLRVLCTLGDQGFTNAFQGLVPAVQEGVRIVYLVCDNGRSVSLEKQAAVSGGARPGGRRYLGNVPGFGYRRVAEAIGVTAWSVEMRPDAVEDGADALKHALAEADAADGPALIELTLPSDPEVWRGIWLTQGFDEAASPAAQRGDPPKTGATASGAPSEPSR